MHTLPISAANARHLTLFCLLAAPCAAQQIIQPTAVSTTLAGSSSLLGMIDQSGLSATYVDGETDFAAFVGATTHANSRSQGMSRGFAAGRVLTLDLGVARRVDAIALWGLRDLLHTLTEFTLFADTDGNFGNGTTASLGSFNQALDMGGRSFVVAPVTTRFVHIRLDANGGGSNIRLGEVAFRRATVAAVPAPTVPTTRVDFDDLPVGSTSVTAINAAGRSGDANIRGIFSTFPSNAATVPYDTNTRFGRALGVSPFGRLDVVGNSGSDTFRETASVFITMTQPITEFGFRIGNLSGPVNVILLEGSSVAARLTTTPFDSASGLFFVQYAPPSGSQGFDGIIIDGDGNFEWVLTELEVQVPVEELGVVNTIEHNVDFVGGVAYDAVTDEVIVADSDDTINFYDRATGIETLQFPAPGSVIGVQVDITTGNLWTVDEDEVVQELDRSGVVVSSFSVSSTVSDASALAIDPVSDTIWISNDTDNDVREFRKDGTPTGASFSPAGSTDGDGLAYDPTTRRFLIGEDTGDAILVVDRAGALLQRIDVGALGLSPEGLAVDSTTGIVFCGNGRLRTVSEVTGILATLPAGALSRYGTPCGSHIAASDVAVDDGATASGLWIGYQGALPPGSNFVLMVGTARRNIPLAAFLPSPCTILALPDLLNVAGTTNGNGRAGVRLAVPPGFPGFSLTAWAADVDLSGIPSSSGGLEIVVQ